MSAIITDSVISSTSVGGSSPAGLAAPRGTSSTIVSDCSCLTDRLTLIVSGAGRGNCSCSAARLGGTPRCSTQRPIGTIRPVSSASGMNSTGGIVPRVGCVPAQQRLDAVDRAAGEADDRLVVHRELAVVERALEVGAQLEPLDAPRSCMAGSKTR